MGLLSWLETPGLPPLCGCGVRPHETEDAGLLIRRCPRCRAVEKLSLGALQEAAKHSAPVERLNLKYAR